ncbi:MULTISPECIES: RNA polymerase sigma factor [Christiangramia]|jgi:RNA polymerase sigma-70 factor (ECF subfamily)|uniref:RNA polymerase ECF-type sigma factor n=2 Tax=Christiangramia forsetii TaxID=411153 RepID=A0M0T9_CHRFK|nr:MULTISPECIES: sigma-70 family RNA polymerase sigma factor [Christiangramia]GGG43375.1 DNA-directed RNA polymerase sigma-70 factor [Christiangramia forsetii]CAL66234.1 RNA polymerase ECF-type sigma factor [Christiangramia forsetii KT0803]|tara:strand:- start:726 stop:1316 length:591 start_codon:yes stop_codon:yes gene_type:complete
MEENEMSELIERLKKGEEEAFIQLVDLYNARLFGYALTLTNDQALAQDIIQNVFLRTWERRRKLQIATSSLKNFLFKSVYNEFINQYKKNRSTMALEQKYFEALDKAVQYHSETSWEKIMTRITKEIENLPPKCREVLLLSRKEGLTNLEISEYLKVSIKTVEAHLTKAFGVLRNRLGEEYRTFLFVLFGRKGFQI